MLEATILFALGVYANVLIGLPAMAQAPASFEPVASSIAVPANYIGPHEIMWATDYPHPDGFFPGAYPLV